MNRGTCQLCGKEYTSSGIAKHLRSCINRQYVEHALVDQPVSYMWVSIRDAYDPDFWMHVLVDEEATLELVDAFLRGVWLECCGHLSEFNVGEQTFGQVLEDFDPNPDYTMGVQLKHILVKDDEFSYIYDFGESSVMELKVRGRITETVSAGAVILIARNTEPTGLGGNSPRIGMCGYVEDDAFDYSDLIVKDFPPTKDNQHSFNRLRFKGMPKVLKKMMSEYMKSATQSDASRTKMLEKFVKDNMDEISSAYDMTKKLNKLVDVLPQLTVPELKAMGLSFHLKPQSNLNKAERVAWMARKLPEGYLRRLRCLGTKELRILKSITVSGGSCENIESSKGGIHGELSRNFAISMLVFVVEEEGLGHQLNLFIPNEIYEVLKSVDWQTYEEYAKVNDLWVQLTKGLLYYYGVVTVEALVVETSRLTGTVIEKQLYLDIIEFYESMTNSVQILGSYMADQYVVEPYELLDNIQQHEKLGSKIQRKRFRKKEVIEASVDGYIQKTKEVKALMMFFNSAYGINQVQMDDFMLDLLDQMDEDTAMNDLIGYISQRFEMPNTEVLNEVMGLMANVYNHRRQWVLKGYSPNEILGMQAKQQPGNVKKSNVTGVDFVAKKKVGRNDPCPCGSGKKFKHCCLGK